MDDVSEDEVATTCVMCGNPIPAGKWPPTCSTNCYSEWEIESEFNRWARKQAEHERKT